jgi:hypothetical protein
MVIARAFQPAALRAVQTWGVAQASGVRAFSAEAVRRMMTSSKKNDDKQQEE